MTRLAESIKSLNESSYVLIVIALGVVVYASLSVVLPSPVNVMEVRNLVTAKECVVDGNCLSDYHERAYEGKKTSSSFMGGRRHDEPFRRNK